MEMKEKGDSMKLLDKMVNRMKKDGLILDDMSFGALKYMGVCKLKVCHSLNITFVESNRM
jgi:hypothetical protein